MNTIINNKIIRGGLIVLFWGLMAVSALCQPDTGTVNKGQASRSMSPMTTPPGNCSITGTSALSVNDGQVETYGLSCVQSSVRWECTSGAILASSNTSATVRWDYQGGVLTLNAPLNSTVQKAQSVSTAGHGQPSYSYGDLNCYIGSVLIASYTIKIMAPVVSPLLIAGHVTPESQTVNINTSAQVLFSSAATGGSGGYTYQWMKSTDSSSWSSISGATTLSYAPGPLTAKTWYRVHVQSGGEEDYSNTAVVLISQALVSGSVSPGSQSITFNSVPGLLTSTAPSGGTGSYSYQWQQSSDNQSWSNLPGAVTLSYQAGHLLSTTYYRLRTISGAATVYSGSAVVTVAAPGPGDHVPAQPTSFSIDQNYIASWTATAAITDVVALKSRPLTDVKLQVQYIDGLGRPVQTVLKQGSLISATLQSADLITPYSWDSYGRDTAAFLPYVGNGSQAGGFRSDAVLQQSNWYGGNSSPVAGQGENGADAHSLTRYEDNPLNRVARSYAPGSSWVGTAAAGGSASHGVSHGYYSNTATDAVRDWNIDISTSLGATFSTPTTTTTYSPGELYKDIITDEAGRQVISFTDKQGRIVLKKIQLTGAADNGQGQGHAGWLCTYYVYDDLGQLRCVIQPEGVGRISSAGWSLPAALLKEQCFRYEYDDQGHMIIKQVPGSGAVYMIYDKDGRLVMTQDAVMRATHQWVATRYDELDRADTTWLYNSGTTGFSTLLTAAAASSRYPAASPPAADILTITHYDDYNGLPQGMTGTYLNTWNAYLKTASTSTYPYPMAPAQITATSTPVSTKGMVTWTSSRVLDSLPAAFITTCQIYDNKGRVIQTKHSNITGGVDVATTQYSWSGLPLINVLSQQVKKGGASQTTVQVSLRYYDDLGRVIKTEARQMNSKMIASAMTAAATISDIAYDALGQVKTKGLGRQRSSENMYSSIPLEEQNYDYNIRGWLLGVNRAYVGDQGTTDNAATATLAAGATLGGEMFTEASDATVIYPTTPYFGYDLGYDKKNSTLGNIQYTAAQYTGDITGTAWKTAYDRKLRKYDYTYDRLSRLTGAAFGQYTGSSFSSQQVNYSVTNLSYDQNGNIKTMNQYGLKNSGSSGLIDQLAYGYQESSNKLIKVTDAAPPDSLDQLGDFQDGADLATEYSYDENGNMTGDANKKISFVGYNYLNLPDVIKVSGRGSIYYSYDAAGVKLRKRVVDSTTLPVKITTTLYVGNAVYVNDTLQFFATGEGRARVSTGNDGWIYDYFLKDHLGNTRMVITDDYNVASPILEVSSYYPFGLQQKGIGLLQEAKPLHNKYTYNGKELLEDLGLDQYDYGARFYDVQIGRFSTIDPMEEVSRKWSPYGYSYNNPIRFTDIDGMIPGDFLDENGKKIGSDGKDDGKLYVIKTTNKKFDSEAPSAGISKNDKKSTEKFIKDNNENTSAFEANDIAYRNSVEIVASSSTRQGMVDVVNQDNGNGGTADANNREYGGFVKSNGTVVQATPGPVSDPIANSEAHIDITSRSSESRFHSHPSGTKTINNATGDVVSNNSASSSITVGGSTTSGHFRNAPSNTGGDIQNSGSTVNYEFSRGNGIVYIYNNTGVIATIPQKYFVTPKK